MAKLSMNSLANFYDVYKELSDLLTESVTDSDKIIADEFREFTDLNGRPLDTKRYIDKIESVIRSRDGNRHLSKGKHDGILHIHHIQPRKLNGPDVPENKVTLTFEDHLDAHRILYEDNPWCSQALYAYSVLLKQSGLSREEIATITRQIQKDAQKRHSGKNNPMFGIAVSDEQKAKHSDLMKNSLTNTKVTVVYDDNTKKIFNGKQLAAEALGLANGSQVGAFCNYYQSNGKQGRPISKELRKQGVVAIYNSDDKGNPVETNNTTRSVKAMMPVIGISEIDFDDKIEAPSIAAAAKKIFELNTINQTGSAASSPANLVSGIAKAAKNNAIMCAELNASTDNDIFFTGRYNYYWFYKDLYTPEVEAIVKDLIDENTV